MATNFLYINLIFFLTFTLYILGQFFDKSLLIDFYLLFSLFIIFSTISVTISHSSYFKKEGSEFLILTFGYLIYGIANLFWYFFDIFKIDGYDFLNLLFVFQALTKQYFLLKDSKGVGDKSGKKVFEKIITLNILLLSISLIFFQKDGVVENFMQSFFLFEALLCVLFVKFYLLNSYSKFLNYELFLYGNLFWIFGDISYSYAVGVSSYISGGLSDFIYFLGFYLILNSFIFKNFAEVKNQLIQIFDKRFLY